MKATFVNYNYVPTWLLTSDFDYLIYDRSDSKEYLKDFPQERIRYTQNIGNVDYDKLNYLIEFYDHLPDIFLWGKSNLFKYVSKAELDEALSLGGFQPLLKKDHRTYKDQYGVVCFYDGDNMYRERNDSWFLNEVPAKHVKNWNEWAREFGLPQPEYIPFAPGGNYLLTKEKVHLYSRDYYIKMRNALGYTQTPGEAQCAERSYYLMWK